MPARQTSLQPESFLRGAMIITLAGLFSRLMGALYKPIIIPFFAPYDGYNGQAGIGLVQVVYSWYMTILSVSVMGINTAISKLVADRMARALPDEARRVFRISLGLMAGLGLFFSLLFFLGADALAALMNRPETALGFRAIAPAILFVAIMAAYRGLFQGLQIMTPYAMSQIYEQLVRVLTGTLLIWLLVRSRETVPLGAAGYMFGAVTGAMVGLAYLLYIYARQQQYLFAAGPPAAGAAAAGAEAGVPAAPRPLPAGAEPEPSPTVWGVIRQVLRLAAPISIIAAVQSLVQNADAAMVTRRLESAGLVTETAAADAALGMLTNGYSITYLPPILTNALYVGLVPAITRALAQGRPAEARARATEALRLTTLFGIPATVGIALLAEDIFHLFFRTPAGGAVLRTMALLTLVMMLQQTTSGILQGAGDIGAPVRNFLIGLVFKVVLTYWWTGLPALGVHGAAWASTVAFAIAAGLNLWSVWRRLGVTMDLTGMWLKPGLASLGMGALIWWLDPLLAARLGALPAAVMVILLAVPVYFGLMLAIGGLNARDFEMIPRFGPRLAVVLRRRRLLRD